MRAVAFVLVVMFFAGAAWQAPVSAERNIDSRRVHRIDRRRRSGHVSGAGALSGLLSAEADTVDVDLNNAGALVGRGPQFLETDDEYKAWKTANKLVYGKSSVSDYRTALGAALNVEFTGNSWKPERTNYKYVKYRRQNHGTNPDAPACTNNDVHSGPNFCVTGFATDPAAVAGVTDAEAARGGRIRRLTFRAGWKYEDSPGGGGGSGIKAMISAMVNTSKMKQMCGEIAKSAHKALTGSDAGYHDIISGHVINHKLGGGNLYVDLNPLNFFPQEKRCNSDASAWCWGEQLLKLVSSNCGPSSWEDTVNTCYGWAELEFKYADDSENYDMKTEAFTRTNVRDPAHNLYMPVGGLWTLHFSASAWGLLMTRLWERVQTGRALFNALTSGKVDASKRLATIRTLGVIIAGGLTDTAPAAAAGGSATNIDTKHPEASTQAKAYSGSSASASSGSSGSAAAGAAASDRAEGDEENCECDVSSGGETNLLFLVAGSAKKYRNAYLQLYHAAHPQQSLEQLAALLQPQLGGTAMAVDVEAWNSAAKASRRLRDSVAFPFEWRNVEPWIWVEPQHKGTNNPQLTPWAKGISDFDSLQAANEAWRALTGSTLLLTPAYEGLWFVTIYLYTELHNSALWNDVRSANPDAAKLLLPPETPGASASGIKIAVHAAPNQKTNF